MTNPVPHDSARPESVQPLCQVLWDARAQRKAIAPLTKSMPDLSTSTAYAVAWQGAKLRQDQGEKIVGYKMGLTSEAKRQQMQLREPIYGILTDAMQLTSESPFDTTRGIHPKAEPEIAFHVKKGFLSIPTPEEAFYACDRIAPAIEVLDSRFEGFKYFSLPDVIADNSSSSHFLIGDAVRRDTFAHWQELAALEMRFLVGEKLVHQARASEISGNPILSLVALCELFFAQGRTVPPECWVLAGAATPAVALEPRMEVRLETTRFAPVVLRTR